MELAHRDGGEAGEVHEGVLEHAAMTSREDEAVAIEPGGVIGVEVHEFLEQEVAGGGRAHWKARVARARLLYGIDREEAHTVYRVCNHLLIRALRHRRPRHCLPRPLWRLAPPATRWVCHRHRCVPRHPHRHSAPRSPRSSFSLSNPIRAVPALLSLAAFT